MHSGQWRLGHRPGLDGLRGIAIGLVLLAHTLPDRFDNGGSVGVTVFFALSGFLITSLLVEERASLRRFYVRRARRLLPALLVYLAVWTALAALEVGPFRTNPVEVIGALFYFENWLMATHQTVSVPVGITWSLSIEEQFYLLWPATFLLARRWPRLPVTVAALGVVVAVMMRVVSWGGPTAIWSIYYRTDTRMDSLLIGCLLALAAHHVGTAWADPRWGWFGVVTLGVLLAIQGDALKYGVAPFAAAVATCALIVSILAGGSSWLHWSPLRWLGRRSYALYLWHYPLTTMARDGLNYYPMWVAVVLSLTAAEVSWWVVERPFRRSGRGVVSSDPGARQGRVEDRDLVKIAKVEPG